VAQRTKLGRMGAVKSVIALLVTAILATVFLGTIPDSAVALEQDPTLAGGENWPNSNESDGCTGLLTRTPLATKIGSLSSSERILGPYGDMFGRTVDAISNDLVAWVVPGSGGMTVRVHERALPAFVQVAANLAVQDDTYVVQEAYTSSYNPRTVSKSYGISRHTFGIAIDINSNKNPFQSGPFEESDSFITNMPAWFVKAWTDAGFCWGGDWKDSKDPMHFSWQGAGFTPGYGDPPPSYPVTSAETDFEIKGFEAPVAFAGAEGLHLLGDITGDGAPDAIRAFDKNGDVVVQFVSPRSEFAECWGGSTQISNASVTTHQALVADFAGYGRAEVGLVDESGATVSIKVLTQENWGETVLTETSIPVRPDQTYVVGDYNWDNSPDIYVIVNSGSATAVEVWDGATGYSSLLIDLGELFGDTTGWQFALGDRDFDDRPDLYAFEPAEGGANIHIFTNKESVLTANSTIDLAAGPVTVADLDGDGRDDIWMNVQGNSVTAWMGSDATPTASWIVNPSWSCPSEWTPLVYSGRFYDDDTSIFESEIEWLAAANITLGCNPPENDQYCPGQSVTRGQMAAFLVRALTIPAADSAGFTDTTDSIFIADIDSLAAANITLGCNPPENDQYCPGQSVTRGQMAAFLFRALGPS